MSEEEAMFGHEPKPKSKPKINLTKWFALGVGGLLGLSYIGMVGMVVNKSKNQLPKLDIPVGPYTCLLYTSPSPRDIPLSRMPSSA